MILPNININKKGNNPYINNKNSKTDNLQEARNSNHSNPNNISNLNNDIKNIDYNKFSNINLIDKMKYNDNAMNNENNNSENIKVCLRVRPMNQNEINRNDKECINIIDKYEVNFISQNTKVNKNYVFDYVFNKESSQNDVFYICAIPNLIDSVIEGYSVTIFAYGQTGSGKTYSILGKDSCINKNEILLSEFAGLIPKTVTHIWAKIAEEMKTGKSKFYIKSSFCEIYNETINDLLNPDAKNINIRFSADQGFFVKGLNLVNCDKPDDLVEIILEGVRNRKVGSHNINPDSSRSHSLLTIYIICESKDDNSKKYGKITFVDLAGSERLKESGSSGIMIKETGNINKSLFVLGKVINALSDNKRTPNQFIPYRDSKLTMLLSDSIGGSSKTLMIACVSPCMEWSEETLSTLNYATKTKKIANKPVIQIQDSEKEYFDVKKENDILKKENEILKTELIKLTGNYNIGSDEENEGEKVENDLDKEFFFPELIEELNNIRDEKSKYTKTKEQASKQIIRLQEENKILAKKLNNLELVLIGPSKLEELKIGQMSANNENNLYNLSQENSQLRNNLSKLEFQKNELKNELSKVLNPGVIMKQDDQDLIILSDQNKKLVKKAEFLQKRERELLQTLMQLKNNKKNDDNQ